MPDEVHYSLGYGHKTADVEGFFASIERWLAMPDRKAICAERRAKMLSEKVDYAKFLTYFIENYPSSADQTRNATADFWKNFKWENKNRKQHFCAEINQENILS